MSTASSDEPVWRFEYDVPADSWFWSPGLRELHGLQASDAPTTRLLLERVLIRDVTDRLQETAKSANTKFSSVAERVVQGLSNPHYSREDLVGGLLDILLDLEQGTAAAAILINRNQPHAP